MGDTSSDLGASELAPVSPPKKKPDKPRIFGLTQVYPDPKNAVATEEKEIDIIVLHGLDARSDKTFIAWRVDGDKTSGDVHWLSDEDMLPSQMPQARVLTYDWNANYDKTASKETMRSHADTLLERVHLNRAGLLTRHLSQALVGALELQHPRSENRRQIYDHCIGLVFLGTPFRGSWDTGTKSARLRIEVAKKADPKENIQYSMELIQYLKEGTDDTPSPLDDLMQRFQESIHNLKYSIPHACLYETQPAQHAGPLSRLSPEDRNRQTVIDKHGKAGSGKSTLIKEAVARAEAMPRDSKSICLSYFFDPAKYDGLATQISPQGLYRSLLAQLLRKINRSPQVAVLAKEWGPAKEARQATVEDVVVLKDRISRLLDTLRGRTIRIFIDAIDECGKGRDQGTSDTIDMLKYIRGLQGKVATVLVLFSIRDRAQFGSNLSVPTIEISHHNQQDIAKFLNDNLQYSTSSTVREQLIQTLLRRSSNVFLWAKLVVQSINLKDNGGFTDSELRREVDRVPGELEGLYHELLNDLDSEYRSEALILLQLVQVRMRPLDVLEIRSALEYARGTDNGPVGFGMSEEEFEARILRICRGFIEIQTSNEHNGLFRLYDNKEFQANKDANDLCELPETDLRTAPAPKRLVQFTHDSVRDFLDTYGWGKLDIEPSHYSTVLRAHFEVAKLCMRIAGDLGKEPSFLPYAAQFWTLHARKANEAIPHDFQPPKFVSNCSYKTKRIISRYKEHASDPYTLSYLQRTDIANTDWLADNASMLMLLAFEGCGTLVTRHGELFQRQECRQESKVRDAFALALLRGWKAAVEAGRDLAENRSIQLDPTIYAPFTNRICPLRWVCERNQDDILQSILNIGWDTTSTEARVSFCEAVKRGHGRIVKLFLENAGDDVMGLVSWQSSQGYTALHFAATAGRWRIFEMLLDSLDDVSPELLNIKAKGGETVLDMAERGKKKHQNKRNNDQIIEQIQEILLG
ncbi:hypothetical protein IL306_008516 [Fusarium sp. DS 682]|nr:hypothetical protein IL306_008516 [Fusarium sp. DS 682]